MTISIWILFGVLTLIIFIIALWIAGELAIIMREIKSIKDEYTKVTSILGTKIPPKLTRYKSGDIVVIDVHGEKANDKNFLLHIGMYIALIKYGTIQGLKLKW